MYFDSHAHYDDAKFDDDRDTVLSAFPSAGIGRVVNPGCTVASSEKAVEMAKRYSFLYAAVGIHPEECHGTGEADFSAIEALLSEEKVVAVGEIGLDYYWDENPPRDVQRDVFARQLSIAEQHNLPVIVHDRDAHGDCIDIVRAFPNVRGVFHCYSGSVEDAKILLDRGWYLGFGGAVTFKNAKKAPEVVAYLPSERLLLETDSPYLAPVPYRGKRNDSRYLMFIAERIAQIRSTSADEIAKLTWNNASTLFNIA